MEYQLKMNELYENLTSCTRGIILKDEPLKNHTYFKIGGPATIFAEPEDTEDLKTILNLIKKYEAECFIMGNGTNLLVSDCGYNGIVVKIGEKFNYFHRDNNTVTAGAGVLLSVLAKYLAKE